MNNGRGSRIQPVAFFVRKITGGTMRQNETAEWIRELIRENKLYQFYKSKEWLSLREQVICEVHNECVMCRQKGIIRPVDEVHHVQYVRSHPELALSRTYHYHGMEFPNLLPLCHRCHDEIHERFGNRKKKQVNEERW